MADIDYNSALGNSRRSLLKSGVRIDMTPMVDVIMLLLTFFMLTTTLTMPQAMQIDLPKGDDHVSVNMGNILTIRASEKGNVFFSQGFENGTESAPKKINASDVSNRLASLAKANNNLLIILKFDRNVKYTKMVDLLDDINTAISKDARRFSIKKMENADLEIIRKAEN